MRVALIGASGKAGSRILAELLRRGHRITAIARTLDRLVPQSGVETKRGDACDACAGVPRLLVGGDDLLTDAAGASAIAMEDYAIALVDELEAPRHTRQRFTVGYRAAPARYSSSSRPTMRMPEPGTL
jgi:putative NADH-flavin reductase